jgi:hypothetical protein
MKEVFEDATSFSPKTIEGQMVRDNAISSAMYYTLTHDTRFSKVSLKIREFIDDASGDLQLGSLNIPFAKTPANAISVAMEMGGGGVIYSLFNFKKAWQDVKLNKVHPRDAFRKPIEQAISAGTGIIVATLIYNALKPDDFVGAYPLTSSSEKELLKARNAGAFMVKIGKYWVSTDYFGPLQAYITGMLYYKKYGQAGSPKMVNALAAGLSLGGKIPGVKQLADLSGYIRDLAENPESVSKINISKDIINNGIDFATARLIPSIVGDFAAIFTTYQRETGNKADNVWSGVMARIPSLRNLLPIKKDVFGNEKETDNAISQLLFGARVKESMDNNLLIELERLNKTGNLPSLSDISLSSSRVKELKELINSNDFEDFIKRIGESIENEFSNKINSGNYQSLSDEEKKNELNKIRNKQIDTYLKRYGWRPKKK